MNVHEKLMKSFMKVKDLYLKEEVMEDLFPILHAEALGHKRSYERAVKHIETIKTLPHLLSDVASFILGWCHGNEYIEEKLKTGEITIGEIIDALFVCVILAEDHHE